VWPPSSFEDVLALYGGPRRFLLVNVPAVLLALGADFFGSMRTLLSIDALRPLVRRLRLDGVYPVRGFKRHYIDEPLSCTFSFPGDWVYDPMLEMALQRRKFSTYSSGGRSGGRSGSAAPLPLVSICPQAGAGTGLSLGLFVTSAGRATTLAEALGSLEEAQAGNIRRFLAGSPPGAEAEAISASAVSAEQAGGRGSYRFELRVRTAAGGAASPDAGGQAGVSGIDGPLSVWTTAQLAQSTEGRPAYLLMLTGVAPLAAPADERSRVQASVESLEAL